jgi:hypothetical protein
MRRINAWVVSAKSEETQDKQHDNNQTNDIDDTVHDHSPNRCEAVIRNWDQSKWFRQHKRRLENMCVGEMQTSPDIDVNFATLNFDRVGLEVDADGSAHGSASCIVEASVMLGALDGVVHDQAISQMYLLVRAQAISRVIPVIWRTVDCERSSRMVETQNIFICHVFCSTGFKPIGHSSLFLFGSSRYV